MKESVIVLAVCGGLVMRRYVSAVTDVIFPESRGKSVLRGLYDRRGKEEEDFERERGINSVSGR